MLHLKIMTSFLTFLIMTLVSSQLKTILLVLKVSLFLRSSTKPCYQGLTLKTNVPED